MNRYTHKQTAESKSTAAMKADSQPQQRHEWFANMNCIKTVKKFWLPLPAWCGGELGVGLAIWTLPLKTLQYHSS